MSLPVAKRLNYKQHYKSEWEEQDNYKHWLKPVSGDTTKGQCIYCKREFLARISDIKRHSETSCHKKKAKPWLDKSQTKIELQQVSQNSQAEASLSLFIAEHCATAAVDHLGCLCANVFQGSEAAKNLKLHRTKCTAIIQMVLAPHFKTQLVSDIDNESYSLILDESTDISVKKYVGVVVKYFSRSKNEIISTYLGLHELENSDAEGIVTSLINLLKNIGLKIENLIGIGTDNAFVMTGVNTSVYTILKEKYGLKHLILVRCVCHSIQLAVSHASVETIPRQIEFLIRETHNWFKISPKRQSEYKNLYESLNCGEKPLKILKSCDTRWISIEPAITRILSQWKELKEHFKTSRISANCYKADMLYAMFSDEQNELYLIFLRCILDETQSTLKTFEQKAADPTLLFQTLQCLIRKLCLRIIIPQARLNFDDIDVTKFMSPNPYLGYIFETKLQEANLSHDSKKGIKNRCVDFVIKLISQLQQRLPENLKCLQNSSCLSVTTILKPTRLLGEIIALCESFGYAPADIDKIVEQWRTIILQQWTNKDDTIKFWGEVKDSKDAAGTCPYKEIFTLATKVFSLPHSNADIERVFSLMNVVKNKLRNSLSLDTINAILHVRYGLALQKSNCANYLLPSDVIRKISSTDKYKFKIKADPCSTEANLAVSCIEEEYASDADD